MFGSDTLDVAIGLAFLFFILSLVLTSAREAIEGVMQTRAIHLERGIREMLKDAAAKDGGLVRQLYGHPVISSLFRGDYPETLVNRTFTRKDTWKRAPFRSSLPAYIPARNFAVALLDLAGRGPPSEEVADRELTFDRIREGLDQRITDPGVRRAVLLALEEARGNLDQARANLAAWFDSGMDRVSGWYRKETQWILLALGLLVAFVLNIDALKVAETLYKDASLRSVIVAEAQAVAGSAREGEAPADQAAMLRVLGCGPELAAGAQTASPANPAAGTAATETNAAAAAPEANVAEAASNTPASQTAPPASGDANATPARNRPAEISCAQRRINSLGLPIGWGESPPVGPGHFGWNILAWIGSFHWWAIPGWLVTAFAISLGAPFWFDLLNKMMVIRSTVKPHEKSPEEDSEDRQRPTNRANAAPPPRPAPAPAPAPVSPPEDQDPAEPNRMEADEDELAAREAVGKIDPREGEE